MLRVLVDADNVIPRRVEPVLELLAELPATVHITASGRAAVLRRIAWPPGTELLASTGWQQADLALATAYSPSDAPLLLVTGDGDFGLLAARHPGPVLVVSGAASTRLREGAVVVDPAVEGVAPIRHWLREHGLLDAGARPAD